MEVVIYKPHGTKVAIRPKEFNPKVHERIIDGKVYKKVDLENKERTLEEMTLAELNAEYFELTSVRAVGKYRVNRAFLIGQVKSLREQKATLESKKEAVNLPVKESSPVDDVDIGTLKKKYKELYGKNAVGKWSKDANWLIKKINEKEG